MSCVDSYAQLIFDKATKNIQPPQKMLLGKVVICLKKTETRSMPINLYKCELKVN
jgi:hypothetical protein